MRPLPTLAEFKKKLTLQNYSEELILRQRLLLASILRGDDPRIAIACGPCSLHSQESALEFGQKLLALQEEVKDRYYLIMRAYIEKPRTALGWKGKLYGMDQKDPSELIEGLHWSRETFLKLVELGVPLATEFLDPIAAPYFEDLITWGFIGSRTTLSQIHRQLASDFTFPVGFKNTPDGSTLSAINAIRSAQERHLFFHINDEGVPCAKKSQGNPLPHLVLRGSDQGSNYDADSVAEVMKQLESHHLSKCIVIDCSHGNSGKDPSRQCTVFEDVIAQYHAGNTAIRGAMIECHLQSGSQPFSKAPSPAYSLTDPCLSFDETAELLRKSTLSHT